MMSKGKAMMKKVIIEIENCPAYRKRTCVVKKKNCVSVNCLFKRIFNESLKHEYLDVLKLFKID